MKDRIKQLMDAQHMNQQAFANYIGVNGASLSSIFTGRTSPTLNIVNAIKNRFPNVNTDWLLYGTGGMFNLPQNVSSKSSGSSSPSLFDSAIMAENKPANAIQKPQSSIEKSSSQGGNTASGEDKKDASKVAVQPAKHIVEIKVFYSDGTFETLKP